MKEYTLRDSEFKLRYSDFYGKEVPILFIHGLGCAGSFDYIDIAIHDAISDHRRIVPDLLGAGYSDKPKEFTYNVKAHAKYLNEFIDDMGLERVIVFGHSLGGAVAIELCNLCKDKVDRLILSEPNLRPSIKGEASREFANIIYKNLEADLMLKIKEYEATGNTMWVSSLRNWLPKAVYEISKDAIVGGEPLWKDILSSFDFPCFFLYGEKSLLNKDYEELQNKNKNIRLIKDAGHSMAWENPSELAMAIRSCL